MHNLNKNEYNTEKNSVLDNPNHDNDDEQDILIELKNIVKAIALIVGIIGAIAFIIGFAIAGMWIIGGILAFVWSIIILLIYRCVSTIIDAKEEKFAKECEENEEMEQIQIQLKYENLQHEKMEKEKAYLKNNAELINNIIQKYSNAVFNYLKNVQDKAPVFVGIVNKIEDSVSPNLLISKYWKNSSLLLKKIFEYDGFYYQNYDYLLSHTEIEAINGLIEAQNLTEFFISGLKKRIIENNDWQDNSTLPCVIYFLIRNNTICFYHDMYVKEIGWESIEELCLNSTKDYILNDDGILMFYVFYHLYETDINLPFTIASNKVRDEVIKQYDLQLQTELDNSLFGTSKELANDNIPEEFRLENLPTKPIEKIDIMTGEEFERFMENYFIDKGYKVTRTPLSGDYGIDLIIEHEFGKIGVQLKCYLDKVSLKAVQEVVSGLNHYGLSSGIVITNSYFQPSAKRLANDNKITLWDRDTLIEKLEA